MIRFNPALGNPRRIFFYGAIVLFCLILLAGFYHLQIVQENEYRERSDQNSVKMETEIPVRGLIYDRNGELIADNRPSFSLYLVPALTKPQTIEYLSDALDIPAKDIRKRFRRSRRFRPLKIARYVDQKILTGIQENIIDLPGLEWRVEPKRHYIIDRAFAHVLGTLGEIDEAELNRDDDYEAGDVVGKKGIEKVLDKDLRGKKGYRYVKVDALGRTVASLSTKKNSMPHPGKDLYLTIDSRLQMYADTLLGDRNGTLVAVDVRNGEILTLLSKPNYDLSLFAEAVDAKAWKALTTDEHNPLFDRAIQGTYPPGSTYKMVAAIAALNENIVTPQWRVHCPGYLRIGRRIVRCWNSGGHGSVDLTAAIRGSCNVYFYQLGKKIGIDLWNKYSRMFHFGEKTGIELTTEQKGLVPSQEYYDRRYGVNKWTTGMLANLAIGQGELLVTPLQMAQFTIMLANSGKFHRPHLANKLIDKIDKDTLTIEMSGLSVDGIRPEVFEYIREGMRQVVAGGTGWRAGVWRKTGGGKTGTAQNSHGDSHAWYIGFAPFEDPEIAVAVILENGGSGGGVAAPVVGQFLRRYFFLNNDFDYEEERTFLRKIWQQKQKKARLDSLRAARAAIPLDSLIQNLGQ